MKLKGKPLADKVKAQIKSKIKEDRALNNPVPGLAVILVGEDKASQIYVGHKVKACEEVGIYSEKHELKKSISSEELKEVIFSLNKNPKIHGILLQLPIPKHLNSQEAISWIDPKKDVDCLGAYRLGELVLGQQKIASCTPSGIIALLKENKIEIRSKEVCIIGRSNIVGKPLAHLFLQEDATVTICHSKTKNLKELSQRADIVVAAMGKVEALGKDYFKEGVVIIDVGIHRKEDGSICGDVRLVEVESYAKAYSPVPGGVGPLTIAYLLHNTYKVYLEQEEKK